MIEKIYYELIPSEIPPDKLEWLRKVLKTGCEKGYLTRYKPPRKGEKITVVPDATMIRLGALYGRKPTTQWSKKEFEAYKTIGHISEEDISFIERYHKQEKKKPSGEDYRRRDLQTLLNNWSSELDRARNCKYTICQDIAAGVKIEAPEGWISYYEKKLGHSEFQKDFDTLSPEMKKEIIEEMASR